MKGNEVLLSWQHMINIGIIDNSFPNISCNRSKAEKNIDSEDKDPTPKRVEDEEEDLEGENTERSEEEGTYDMEEGDEDETKEWEMDAEEDEEFMDIKRQLLLEYPDVFANDLLLKTMKGECPFII